MGTDAAPHTRIIYVAHDHLNRDRGALRTANMATDVIVLVESARMTTGRNWHKERLFFLVSSARHFATELENSGFTVRYKDAFAKNHRMGQQLMGLKRLSDLPELRVRASEVLAGLDAGTI